MFEVEYKIWSPSIDENWEDYRPEIEDNFMLYLWITINEKGIKGSDDFYLKVCTFKWLLHNQPISWGRHLLIVDSYRKGSFIDEIRTKIKEIQSKCKSYDEFKEIFGRFAQWEFEDYTM